MAKLSAEDKKRWKEIDDLVDEHLPRLKNVTSHVALKNFAEEYGLFNKQDFGKFKVSLRKSGINYEKLREITLAAEDEQRAAELANLAADAPCVKLWVAAVEFDEAASFAIVDSENKAVWYGNFFDDDRIREVGDLISAEQSVATKAIFVAAKALEAHGDKIGRVVITTTCPSLSVSALVAAGVRKSIAVEVIVDDNDLRAVDLAETPGFQRYKDIDLAALVEV